MFDFLIQGCLLADGILGRVNTRSCGGPATDGKDLLGAGLRTRALF